MGKAERVMAERAYRKRLLRRAAAGPLYHGGPAGITGFILPWYEAIKTNADLADLARQLGVNCTPNGGNPRRVHLTQEREYAMYYARQYAEAGEDAAVYDVRATGRMGWIFAPRRGHCSEIWCERAEIVRVVSNLACADYGRCILEK
jgi:hypothetical protein